MKESKHSLQEILTTLSFTPKESEAFLKSIQIMKESLHDENIHVEEQYRALINEVIDFEIHKN